MKITETEEGNIKIVMSSEHADALYNLLDNMTYNQYKYLTTKSEADKISELWTHLMEL